MQLVLSSNRIIAHGENFLSMGGVVINTVTGARYENATIAECDGCPSDIDKVGYEYHAGVFVPCAPFGVGNNNGYVMEVCTDCATPRNSGIPVKDIIISNIKWETIATDVITFSKTESSGTQSKNSFTLNIDPDIIKDYTMYRLLLKAGSTITFDKKNAIGIEGYVKLQLGSTGTPEVLNVSSSQTVEITEDTHLAAGGIALVKKTTSVLSIATPELQTLVFITKNGTATVNVTIEVQARG